MYMVRNKGMEDWSHFVVFHPPETKETKNEMKAWVASYLSTSAIWLQNEYMNNSNPQGTLEFIKCKTFTENSDYECIVNIS